MQQFEDIEYEQLLQFVYACPVGLIDMARDGCVNMVNPFAMSLLMPLSTDGSLSNVLEALHDCAPELRTLVEEFMGRRGTICENHRIYIGRSQSGKSPEPQILSCTIVKLKDDRYLVTLTDISAQVHQEKRLKEAETWFGSLLDGVKDFGVASLRADGCIEAVNKALIEQVGYDELDLKGLPITQIVEAESIGQPLSIDRRLDQARRDGWHLDEGWCTRKNGEKYWCQSLIAVCADKTQDDHLAIKGYTIIVREVKRRDTDILELKRLLQTDHLTGIFNRGAFFDAADRENIRSQKTDSAFSFIMFDVDHFKQINDTYGHAVGDEVLRKIATVCQQCIRSLDTFARIGGEEFAILLPATELDEAYEIAEKIRKSIAATKITAETRQIQITASFGCVEGPISQENASTILSYADLALYEAKRSGRNKTVVHMKTQEPQVLSSA